MIARRVGALILSVGLILGAWYVRDRVIDDDGADADGRSTTPSAAAGELVCITELAAVCNSLSLDDLAVTVEEAGATLDRLARRHPDDPLPIWLTLEPFPAMLDEARVDIGQRRLSLDVVDLGSSSIALVVLRDRAGVLASECGDPIEWECLGKAAGRPWTQIGGDDGWGRVRPGFAPADTSATGLLGFAQAVAGYFDLEPIDVEDSTFVSWVRPVVGAVPVTVRPQPTAIGTIQVRPSLLDIAVGAEAELLEDNRDQYEVQYAEPMVRADVVLAIPDGAPAVDDLAAELGAVLLEARWDAPTGRPNPLPRPRELLRLRELWKEL